MCSCACQKTPYVRLYRPLSPFIDIHNSVLRKDILHAMISFHRERFSPFILIKYHSQAFVFPGSFLKINTSERKSVFPTALEFDIEKKKKAVLVFVFLGRRHNSNRPMFLNL